MTTIAFAALGCQKSDIALQSNSAETISAKGEVCCSVQCRRGNCSTSKTPCTCQCIGGQPSCSGGSISVDSDQDDNYAPVINYLNSLGTWQGDSAANILQSMYDLIVIDNSGILTDSSDIALYEAMFSDWDDLYSNHLPVAVTDSIDAL